MTMGTPASTAAPKGGRSCDSKSPMSCSDDGQAHVRVGGRGAVVGEVLGRRDHAGPLEALDGGGPHPGYQLGVLAVGTVADRGPEARVYHGGEVRVDAGPQELAAHPGRDVARLVGVPAAPDLGRGGLGRDPGRRGDVPALLVHGDEERHGRLRPHGELLEAVHEGLASALSLFML